MDKIDILMATYNGEKYIEEQVLSLVNQTYSNWQLLIRDDGSTDKTLEILERLEKADNRIKILRDNKKNLGFNGNFEKLMKNSNSNYLMFCDQDDIWDKEKVEKTYNVMLKFEKEFEPILVHSDARIVDEKLNIIEEFFVKKRAKHKGLRTVLFSNCVQGCTIMINRYLKDKALPFITSMPYDYYLALLAEMLGERVFMDESLMYYRQHVGNVIGTSKNEGKDDGKTSKTLEISMKSKNEIIKVIDNYSHILEPKRNKVIRDYISIYNNKNTIYRIFLILKRRYVFYRKKDILELIKKIIVSKEL